MVDIWAKQAVILGVPHEVDEGIAKRIRDFDGMTQSDKNGVLAYWALYADAWKHLQHLSEPFRILMNTIQFLSRLIRDIVAARIQKATDDAAAPG